VAHLLKVGLWAGKGVMKDITYLTISPKGEGIFQGLDDIPQPDPRRGLMIAATFSLAYSDGLVLMVISNETNPCN
jgi:hypothetical protein